MSISKNLQVGKVYSIYHQRKGYFIGRLLDVIETEPGDSEPVLLRLEIDVRSGTDQARIANAANEVTAIMDIRPSLITSIEETDPADWQRRVHVPPSAPPPEVQQAEILKMAMKLLEKEKKPSWLNRLRGSLKH